jgi:hypothetical protein
MLNEFMQMLNSVLLWVTAIVCLLIFVILMNFRPAGRRHKQTVSVLAYLFMMCAITIAIMIPFGLIRQTSIPETGLALLLLVVIWRADGNLAHFSEPLSK